jgi:two-component sensor histidine kinase
MADLTGSVVGEGDGAIHDVVSLMREADHRVGNSLQLLSSLLQMQERTLEEGPARDALIDARRRVGCIAQLHRSLASSAGSDLVPLDDYLHSLSNNLWGAFLDRRGIECLLNADPLTVSARMACSIGLAVNELVVDAIKHGFDGDDKGIIEIGCGRDKNGDVQIDVSNVSYKSTADRDGSQAPANECKGFGAKIIGAILRQHQGNMETVMQEKIAIQRIVLPLS